MIEHRSDTEHLATLAEWMAHANQWLEGEVEESRTAKPVDTTFSPEQRIEDVAFISAELDAILTGFRRATDALRTMATRISLSPHEKRRPRQRPHYLRVVK
jgi:hypothetical protein